MSESSGNIIEVRDLWYSRAQRPIFTGLDIDIPRGKITSVMGPSGTGKTTLLRLITRQIRPHKGTIRIDGIDIAELSMKQLFKLRRRFGVLFQNGALLTDYSVFENVAFPLYEHTRLPNRLIRHIVLTKLHAVGLRGAADMMPAELSGGMARRVALARAIVMDPEILVMDEPSANLDPRTRRRLIELLNALPVTKLVATHDLLFVYETCERTIVLDDGRTVADGPTRELLADNTLMQAHGLEVPPGL